MHGFKSKLILISFFIFSHVFVFGQIYQFKQLSCPKIGLHKKCKLDGKKQSKKRSDNSRIFAR